MRAGAMLAVALVLCLLLATPAREAAVELPSPWDAHILDLEQQAIEAAFLQQIALLYQNWMKDYSGPATPQRVATGARNARAAYVHAMTQIERRKGR